MSQNPGKQKLALSKLIYKSGEEFVPALEEIKVLADVVDLFRQAQSERNRNFQYFDGINLIDYINDCVLRFNTNVDERDGIEDWQAAVNDGFTRNKVLAVLGKIMEVLPIANFVGRGEDDTQKAVILNNLYEFVEDLDDYDELMTHILLETIVKGTGIGYEDVEFRNIKRRDVEGTGDKISVTETMEKMTKLYGSIIPLEDFYPSSVSIRKIKDMPYCFWRTVMPLSKFKEGFSNYKKSELVQGRQSFIDNEEQPYYYDYIDTNLPDGAVEVIRFYDKLNDEFIIIANGIWLNPIKETSGEGTTDVISPLPWNHKELPFWDVKFDFFGSDFFYGKSLPDRLKSLQDVLNVLTNMLLDQSFLTIFPPLLTNGIDSIEDDYLRPGRRTPVDTQGLPIAQAFHVLQNPTPTGWHQYILEYTRQVMEEASLDKVSSGTAGSGDRTTAQEIRVAASGVAAMLQMFARMVNTGIKRKAMLKAGNILQFGMNSEAPILRQVMGEGAGSAANKAFTIIKLEGAVLTGGKRGDKIIEFYKNKGDLPTRGDVKSRALIAKADSEREIEIVALPPAYIRSFAFDVKAVPNPKSESTKEVQKAMQAQKVEMYMTFFADIINKNELAAETAEIYGDDPSKLLTEQALGIAPEGGTGQPGMNSQNAAASAAGQSPGGQELSGLIGNITG